MLWPLLWSAFLVALMVAADVVRAYRGHRLAVREHATGAFGSTRRSDEPYTLQHGRAGGRGVRVTVISSMPTAAQDLRRQTDEFVDILDLKDTVSRDPATRQSRSSEGYSAREHRNPPARSRSSLRVGASSEWDDED